MLNVGGNNLNAVSVGGLETCIEVPAWKLCFDIGRCPPSSVRLPRVLFTHAHCDHMAGVIHHCAQRDLQGMSPPTYYLPSESEKDFETMMAAWRKLAHSDLPCAVQPVRPGERVELGRQQWTSVFRAVHRIPTVGYVLGENRKKLKPEFVGQPEAVIRRAAQSGVNVSEMMEVPELAFCGDTCIDVLERESLVRQARILIMEVTFLDERVSVQSARENGHVHLNEVIQRQELFENEHILFTHFSSRYTGNDIVRILDERLPDALKGRVSPLLPSAPWD